MTPIASTLRPSSCTLTSSISSTMRFVSKSGVDSFSWTSSTKSSCFGKPIAASRLASICRSSSAFRILEVSRLTLSFLFSVVTMSSGNPLTAQKPLTISSIVAYSYNTRATYSRRSSMLRQRVVPVLIVGSSADSEKNPLGLYRRLRQM